MKQVSIIAMIGAASAKWGMGECPEVEFKENIDMAAYSGHWYEVYRDSHNMYTAWADCVTKEFELNQDGSLDLYFRGFYNLHGWGKYSGIDGKLFDCGENSLSSGTCMATMGHSQHKHPFKMFATDYENYDIYYDCKSFWGIFHASNLSITSRKMEMSEDVQQEVRKLIKDKIPHYHLDSGMYWTKQGEDRCQYYWMSDHEGKIPENVYW